MDKYHALLSPYVLPSGVVLKNRIVVAPLIQRTADEQGVPDRNTLDFYLQRASAGLIIAGATMISETTKAYSNMPGIYHEQQLNAWRNIVAALHAEGGKIFIQLWHPGRISHRSLLQGRQPLAPSPVKAHGKILWSELDYDMPVAMTEEDMREVIHDFEHAASNAMSVGFDGVEIHSANGYLLEQFLREETNKRRDAYGGSSINKINFPLQVIDAVNKKIGAQHVGVRLSVETSSTLEFKKEDIETYLTLLSKLNAYSLAYIHLSSENDLVSNPILQCRPSHFLKRHTVLPLIVCGSYTPNAAEDALRKKACDLVAFGRPFLENSHFLEEVTA